MVRPLVQAAKKPTDWLVPYGIYAAGTVASSTTLGAVLGALGSTLVPHGWTAVALAAVALLGVALALCDLGVGGMQTPTLDRQTQPLWWRTIGPSGALFLWGADIWLGFTTIRVASLYWGVALAAVALASPLIGAAILGSYGVALAFNLGVGVLWPQGQRCDQGGNVCALRVLDPLKAYPIKEGLAVTLLMWSLFLLIVAVTYR